MIALRQQAISIINDIPDENMAYFLQLMIAAQNLVKSKKEETCHDKIFACLDELATNKKILTEENSKTCHNRATQTSAIIDRLNEMFKYDQGWTSEDDMVNEFNSERQGHRRI